MYTMLYVGPGVDSFNAEDRARCLEDLGHQVIRFNTTLFEHSVSRLSRSLAYRFNYGRIMLYLNHSLKFESYPYDLVWIDKGVWLEEETLDLLKKCWLRDGGLRK